MNSSIEDCPVTRLFVIFSSPKSPPQDTGEPDKLTYHPVPGLRGGQSSVDNTINWKIPWDLGLT
eukprot:scaffold1699_cov252-Ochromonas_danica.AAC.1